MTRGDKPVYERFIFRSVAVLKRSKIVLPLFFGARANYCPAYQAVVQQPGKRELAGGYGTGSGVLSELPSDLEAFRTPLGLKHSLIATASTSIFRRGDAGRVLAGENTAR